MFYQSIDSILMNLYRMSKNSFQKKSSRKKKLIINNYSYLLKKGNGEIIFSQKIVRKILF